MTYKISVQTTHVLPIQKYMP